MFTETIGKVYSLKDQLYNYMKQIQQEITHTSALTSIRGKKVAFESGCNPPKLSIKQASSDHASGNLLQQAENGIHNLQKAADSCKH